MPLPAIGDVHVDRALTNISIAYLQEQRNFVADRVFPAVPVAKRSDKYFTYNKSDFRRDEVKPRAPGAESEGGGFRLDSSNSYSCEIYAFHKDIADAIRDNQDDPINLENDSARWLMQLFLIQKENQWASTYFTTGVWDTDVVGGTDFTKWDDASSDPEKDIDDGKISVLQSTGLDPNTLVVDINTHKALKRHPLVTERFKYTSPDSITEAMLARFFEVDNYMVSKASYDTADEGATDSNSFIAGKNALLCYVAPTPSLMLPSAGYNFVWSGFTGINDLGVRVKNFRLERNAAQRIEGELAYDMKAVATDTGYFFSGTVD